MDLEEAPASPPLGAHPFTPVGDLDAGGVDGQGHPLIGVEAGLQVDGEGVDSAPGGGVVGCSEPRLSPREGVGEAFQLAVGKAEECFEEGLQLYKGVGVPISAALFAPVHLLQFLSPALEEGQVEEDLASHH